MPQLLFVGAHPDDELYAAGLLAALAQRGVRVHLLCLTRGEGGTLGNPPVATRETLGAVREGELRKSAAALGIGTVELLGYVDPLPDGKARAPEVQPDALGRQISSIAERLQAAAILTHGSNGEYGHPAHRLVHEAVGSLNGEGPVLYTFNAAAPGVSLWGGVNRDDPADLTFDSTPVREAKLRAFEAHVSQHSLWLRPEGPKTLDEHVRYHAAWEAFRRHGPAESLDPLREWLATGR
ncbi:MAG TPA: PIG-L deacetylase family protein [Thermoanaerobaculia bacterium]|nr:PIG-L deacetylase family protein [Thermoanaerobaculia bacterium]